MLAEKRDSGSIICFSKGFALGLLMMAKSAAAVIPGPRLLRQVALLGEARVALCCVLHHCSRCPLSPFPRIHLLVLGLLGNEKVDFLRKHVGVLRKSVCSSNEIFPLLAGIVFFCLAIKELSLVACLVPLVVFFYT